MKERNELPKVERDEDRDLIGMIVYYKMHINKFNIKREERLI